MYVPCGRDSGPARAALASGPPAAESPPGSPRPLGRPPADAPTWRCPIDSLVYLSVGHGKHVDELRFSILSAARFLREDSTWRIVVYADHAEPFAALPVEVVPVGEATWAEWVGPHRYVWRAKIKVIAEALAVPTTSRCVYADGDTWFRQSPAEVFARVGPGRSVLHLQEGRPPAPEVAALQHVLARHQPVDTTDRPWSLGPERSSWNAGVVGLHEADADLCREVEHLTDQLLGHGFGELSHTSEQVAFTVCLAQRTALRGCSDVLVHYWPEELRTPFAPVLRSVWADAALSPDAAFDRLWPQRPREPAVWRAKRTVKRLARRAGVRV